VSTTTSNVLVDVRPAPLTAVTVLVPGSGVDEESQE
jgi:hypothetical protein